MGFFIAFKYLTVVSIIKQFQFKKKTIIKTKTGFVPKSERLYSKDYLNCSILFPIDRNEEKRLFLYQNTNNIFLIFSLT